MRSKEVDVSVKEAFSVNSPKASEEEEQVVDIDSSNATPDEPTVKQSTSPEPVDTASDAPTPTIENSEESSSISVGTSEALSLPVSTTTITTIVSPWFWDCWRLKCVNFVFSVSCKMFGETYLFSPTYSHLYQSNHNKSDVACLFVFPADPSC